MSFGTKQYQHRFYTSPKIRSRHDEIFLRPPQQERYRSISAFIPYHQTQVPLKQSYLRLINNGMNSRLFNKDELGYEGLKFEKDVINRYSGDDYRRNSEVLERFKRQAEQLKKKNQHHHSRKQTFNEYNSPQFKAVNESNLESMPKHSEPFIPKHSVSLMPITNTRPFEYTFENQLKSMKNSEVIKNQQNSHRSDPNITNRSSKIEPKGMNMLPSLRLQSYLNGPSNISASVIVEEQTQQRPDNQFSSSYYEEAFTQDQLNTAVCDVGINANLTQPSKQPNSANDSHKRDSLRIQTQKLKNKQLKRKYDQLKSKFIQKSLILSRHQQMNQQKEALQEQRQFQQKIQNLSSMIHSLCDRLRENKSRIIQKVNNYAESQPLVEKQETLGKQSNNQTQINLLTTGRKPLQQSLRARFPKDYNAAQPQSKTPSSLIKPRPKVVYSLSKEQRNIKNDGLRLLKNRLRQQQNKIKQKADHIPFNKGRAKTQGY